MKSVAAGDGDLIGRKRMFLIGLAMFTAASLLSGLSFSQLLLIGAHFLQGVGGALSLLAMAGAGPSDSGLVSGLLNTTTQVGAALGLALLATLAAWRASQLVIHGEHIAAALSGGYHLAWAISAGLVLVATALAAAILRAEPDAKPEAEAKQAMERQYRAVVQRDAARKPLVFSQGMHGRLLLSVSACLW